MFLKSWGQFIMCRVASKCHMLDKYIDKYQSLHFDRLNGAVCVIHYCPKV